MKILMSQVATLVRNANLRSACRITLLMWLLGLSSALLASDTDVPEMDFLEYLGLWEESDEDWVLLSEEVSTQVAAEDARTDSEPEGDESAENDDES